jgi:hypothetical protein
MLNRLRDPGVRPRVIAFVILLCGLAVAGGLARYRSMQEGASAPATKAVSATSPAATNAVASTPIGWVDAPAGDTIVGPAVRITGWALDPAGIQRVEIRIAGQAYAATYGTARPDVSAVKPGFPNSNAPGFEFDGNVAAHFAASTDARQTIDVVAVNAVGADKLLARKNVVLPIANSEWRSLHLSNAPPNAEPFYFLPGVSGITLGGPNELDTIYASYESPTVRVGMRVPLLYMRTTLGAAADWTFDPDWDIERRCGTRRIAEDSLNAVIRHARKHRMPVLFTLNGGVWSDATCGVPEWDATDHLEQDKNNCQWSDRNEVMPDDFLKHLPGSQESPELGRILSFNVYAQANRRYKKRNLQAAGRMIEAFARADPELFVGINLDPDTVHNPFFEEKQWYDYNPNTLKQFRHWLAGTGPYSGRGGTGVPDLRAYRRAAPLTLAQVNQISGRNFRRWEDVDPPRSFSRDGKPFWNDAWTHEWEVFRRHLVDLHYDELSQWLADVGIAPGKIFSSQGFMAPSPSVMPFAIRVDSPSKNYDTGGISIEGALPRKGHIGAVVYGPAARNDIPMETPDSLFATFHRMDPNWSIVEFNTADLRHPLQLPDYAVAYQTLRDAFNFGARFVSPMAWNGSNGIFAGQPGYTSYVAWRNTPLEDAMRDFSISHAYVPRGTRLWTFGSAGYASDDGWKVESGGTLAARNGHVELQGGTTEMVLVSPGHLAIARGEIGLLVLGVNAPDVLRQVRIDARGADGHWTSLAPARGPDALKKDPAGLLVPLDWPSTLQSAEQIRIVLTLRAESSTARLRHLALYPVAGGNPGSGGKEQAAR